MASLPQIKPEPRRPARTGAKPVGRAGSQKRTFSPLERDVEAALELIRPAVRDDGGDVELVDVEGDLVRIRFLGACIGCPSSEMTLRHGIERHLIDQVKGINRVEAVEE